MRRSIKIPNRISDAGYVRRHFCGSARLEKDKVEGGSAENEVVSTVEPSATSEERKERDLKLDTHKLFESCETPQLIELEGLSEANKKSLGAALEKGVQKMEPLKNRKSIDTVSEMPELNMFVSLDEKNRKKILVELIKER